jgi:hypothetical protein
MTHVPGRAHMLSRVLFYTMWYAICRLFSAFVTLFLFIEILTVVGCSMQTICERDRERVGRAGLGSHKKQHSAQRFRGL